MLTAITLHTTARNSRLHMTALHTTALHTTARDSHCPLLTTATCKTRSIIYFVQCAKCGKQYMGETDNPFHVRLNGHQSDIKNARVEKLVAAHFNLVGHSIEDLTIMVIYI